jgi:hypothetical protein
MPQSGFEDGFAVSTSGSLDSWVKEIHAKVPGAIEGYIYDQVKLVIKDFFQRTKAWRTFLGPFSLPANEQVLCLNPVDAYSNVIQVLSVTRNGSTLSQIDLRALPRLFNTDTTGDKTPSRFYLDPYHTIKFWPIPVVDVDDIYVTVALIPRLRADNRIPEWIIDQHYEVIKAGVLQRLYQEPDKSYSNSASAEYWGKKFRSEMARSRSVAAQGYGESPQAWSYPQWNI